MKYSLKKAFLWLGLYTVLALIPLGIALMGDRPEYRSFWIEFGVALGFIGLSTMGLQAIFSGRYKFIAPTFGMDNILQFHREIGIISFFFVLAHPIILILADPEFIKYYDPTVNFPRAMALSFATVGIVGITVTSLWRQAFKLNYEWWRLIHSGVGALLVFVGITHSVQVAHYLDELWKQIAIVVLMGGCVYAVIHTRLVRLYLNGKKPYRIVDIKAERGDSYTMTLEADGFKREDFISGQFFWMTVGDKVFTLQQHPFSIVSSDESDNICFTAKVLGDFTATWKDMKPGTKVVLEGPFGSFTPKGNDPLFMIMGGIGVTPGVSMIRSMVDRDDNREIILVYANEHWEETPFREELEELDKLPNIEVINVVESPPEGYVGETGFVDEDFFKKHLPKDKNDFVYYICGPEPLMDVSEKSLKKLGVDWRRIYSERFEIV
ncbi:ferric reductase-like transmembrane domain-containing protein [Litoribacter alkaliphilus]|uniref:Ferric reductase-like transmembrane domain-containing protein n=1 Tax=Litoribacter ruber TaxID=702568 RepID=A0AAP2G129_9BACT|nr:ferric reductase-like transmembrane domain-containing protein [Litoribacter alkaliphilus]MBS9523417.1 ferric reductase-like transmembrane domain-containing protein [Litoribacter alkaliphilus]